MKLMYTYINKAKLFVRVGRKATGLYPFLEIAELPAIQYINNKGLIMSATLTKELSNKAYMLQNIYVAKRAHKEWVRKADKLVNGLDGYQGKKVNLNVDKTFIPLDSTSCKFGQWFDTYAVQLAKFDSIGRFINRIEEHHNALHDTYAKIYEIFFILPEKRSILHKLITMNSKKVSETEREKAKIHLEYLKKSSKELLEVLEVLEDKIKALDYNALRTFLSK